MYQTDLYEQMRVWLCGKLFLGREETLETAWSLPLVEIRRRILTLLQK